jgi:predicted chitinase
MADNNLGSKQDIDDLSQNFDYFSSQLSSDDKNLRIVELAQKKSVESLKKQKEFQKAAIEEANNTIKGIYNLGKSLQSTSSGKNGFESLNTVIDISAKLISNAAKLIPIPYVGAVIGGVVEGAAEVSKFMIGQFSKAYGNFEKLADTGVISTFEELKESAASIGLTYSDTERVLSKYSTELAIFGGSAGKGRERLQGIAFESKKVGESFQVLGISASDFTDMQTNYIAQHQRSESGRKLTDKELTDGSIQYIEQLDTLSKITGISRKELQDQMMEQNRNTRYLAGIATLDKKAQDNIKFLLPKLKALDTGFGEGLQDAIASGGVGNSDKERAVLFALKAGGMDITAEIKNLREGGDPTAFYAKVNTALLKYGNQYKNTIKYLDGNNIISKSYLASANARNKTEAQLVKEQEEINERRKKDLAETGTEDKKLAETRRKMYNSSRNVELLATGSKTMTSIMKGISTGIEYMVGKLYDFIGPNALPDFLKYRKEERIAIEGNVKLQKKQADALFREATLKTELKEMEKDPTNPKNRQRIHETKEKLKTLKLQIEYNAAVITEQEEKVKIATAKKKKADEAAGMGPTVGSVSSSSGGSGSTGGSGNSSGTPSTSGSGSNSTTGMPAGSQSTSVNQNQQLLLQAMNDLGITDSNTRAAMAATVQGESAFKLQNEISYENTSNANIIKSFGQGSAFARMSDDQLTKLKKNPAEFFDFIYGGRYGNNSPGDGYKYRGRGFIGITFKDNYAKYGKLLGIDLVGNPDLANDPKIAAKIAVMMMRDGMAANKNVYGNSDIYTQVARSIGNANAVTEQGKKDAYLKNLQSGQWGADKTADLSFIKNQPVQQSVAAGNTFPKTRTGGIISGPSTGYMAILHGDEMVIPANSGSAALQFNSTASGNQSDEMIQGILLMMTKKVDKMIGVTRDEISTQRRISMSNIK